MGGLRYGMRERCGSTRGEGEQGGGGGGGSSRVRVGFGERERYTVMYRLCRCTAFVRMCGCGVGWGEAQRPSENTSVVLKIWLRCSLCLLPLSLAVCPVQKKWSRSSRVSGEPFLFYVGHVFVVWFVFRLFPLPWCGLRPPFGGSFFVCIFSWLSLYGYETLSFTLFF